MRVWGGETLPLPQPLIGGLIRLLEPREVGDRLRTSGESVASAIADASGYRTGYQLKRRSDGTVLRGSLPLPPTERLEAHTVQESIGTSQATMAALQEFDARGTADRPKRLISANGNEAAVKNIAKPGNKPEMV